MSDFLEAFNTPKEFNMSNCSDDQKAFTENVETVGPELNSSVFTFAQNHNSIVAENSPLLKSNAAIETFVSSRTIPDMSKCLLLETFKNQQIEQKDQSAPIPEQFETCANCNRQFFVGRLSLHQKSCKPFNPLKPLNLSKVHNILSDQDEHSKQNSNSNNKASRQISESLDFKSSNSRKSDSSYFLNIKSPKNIGLFKNNNCSIENLKGVQSQIIPKWRIEHESLMQSIQQPSLAIDPLTSQYVSCQYCSRKFKPQIAEQHIPNCKNIHCRPKPPKILAKILSGGHGFAQPPTPLIFPQSQSHRTSESSFGIVSTTPSSVSSKVQSNQTEEIEQMNRNFSLVCSQSNSSLSQLSLDKQNNTTQKKLPSSKRTSFEVSETISNLEFLSPIKDIKQLKGETKGVSNLKLLNHQLLDQPSSLPSIFESCTPNLTNNQKKKDYQSDYDDVMSRSKNYSQVSCPYCQRKFAKTAATRHIPICKNIQNRPIRLQKKQNETPVSEIIQENPIKNSSSQIALNVKQALDKPNYFDAATCLNEIGKNFCTNCGSQLSQVHKYCGLCGKKRS